MRKELSIRMLIPFSECQKIPYQSKDKIFEKYNSGLISKRVKPKKYEELSKAVHKWFLILRGENVPISGPMVKQKALQFAGGFNIKEFQASEGWLEKWKKR